MKIEVWSDIVCPFCYIGKRKLEEALAEFPHKEEVEVEFKSYQLDPSTPPYTGQDFYESMALKFGSVEQSKQMMVGITEQGKLAGLDLQFDTMKPTNTLDAHRITKFAKEHGKDGLITEELLYANFTESKDIGNIEVLADIAEKVGLNKAEALAVLEDKEAYAKDVHADIAEAKQLGITSVPYFIFDRKYAIKGGQPAEAFTEVLNKVWEEAQVVTPIQTLSTDTDGTCGDDGCEVPDKK